MSNISQKIVHGSCCQFVLLLEVCCSLNRWFGECVCLHLATEMKADLNRDQVDRRRGKYVEFHPSFFSESTISTAVVLRNLPMG